MRASSWAPDCQMYREIFRNPWLQSTSSQLLSLFQKLAIQFSCELQRTLLEAHWKGSPLSRITWLRIDCHGHKSAEPFFKLLTSYERCIHAWMLQDEQSLHFLQVVSISAAAAAKMLIRQFWIVLHRKSRDCLPLQCFERATISTLVLRSTAFLKVELGEFEGKSMRAFMIWDTSTRSMIRGKVLKQLLASKRSSCFVLQKSQNIRIYCETFGALKRRNISIYISLLQATLYQRYLSNLCGLCSNFLHSQ